MSLDWRPLDPVRSIKAKLALLVAASVTAAVAATWFALVVLGWWIRYTLPLAVVLALVVTQVLARGMTRPLRQMTAAARAMAAGTPPVAVDVSSRDEVGELARAFSAMSEGLAAADAQRRELLANVAHELRTPVAAVRAQVENLVDGVRPPDRAALGEVLDRVERLGGLVEDLLDLARTQGGAAPFRPRPTPLAPLVAEVAEEVGHAHPELAVRVDVPAGLMARVDPSRVRQVLVNLLDNAGRHGGTTVEVVARAAPGPGTGVVVEVADDGPGIAPGQRDSVFERFRRADPDARDEDDKDEEGGGPVLAGTPGTGLGLAIARWAVALHRGRVAVLDTPTCCRVRVELPDPPEEAM